MFNCSKHGWSHIYSPCPLCHDFNITTSGQLGSAIVGLDKSQYDSLIKERDELKALVKELIEHNDEVRRGDPIYCIEVPLLERAMKAIGEE